MARTAYFSDEEIAGVRELRDKATTAMELRKALSVLSVAVSPWNGDLDYMTCEKMNSENMSRILWLWSWMERPHIRARHSKFLETSLSCSCRLIHRN